MLAARLVSDEVLEVVLVPGVVLPEMPALPEALVLPVALSAPLVLLEPLRVSAEEVEEFDDWPEAVLLLLVSLATVESVLEEVPEAEPVPLPDEVPDAASEPLPDAEPESEPEAEPLFDELSVELTEPVLPVLLAEVESFEATELLPLLLPCRLWSAEEDELDDGDWVELLLAPLMSLA